MSLIRWDPFDDLASLRESMDKLFDELFTRRPRGQAELAWAPAVEVFETDNDVMVRAELPGIDPKNVEITVTQDTLTLKGEGEGGSRGQSPELLPARAAVWFVPALDPTAERREG
jgi:HSP20 family protein